MIDKAHFLYRLSDRQGTFPLQANILIFLFHNFSKMTWSGYSLEALQCGTSDEYHPQHMLTFHDKMRKNIYLDTSEVLHTFCWFRFGSGGTSRSTSLITWTSLTKDKFISFTSWTLCFPLAAGDSEKTWLRKSTENVTCVLSGIRTAKNQQSKINNFLKLNPDIYIGW